MSTRLERGSVWEEGEDGEDDEGYGREEHEVAGETQGGDSTGEREDDEDVCVMVEATDLSVFSFFTDPVG